MTKATKRTLTWNGMLFLGAVVIITLIGFSFHIIGIPPAAGSEPVAITILHTGDLHGHLDPFKPRREAEYIGGMARIATLVNKIRAEQPKTILLDGGDTIHGTNLANMTSGESVISVMNALGYDAMVVGNHDFNYGLDVLEKRAKQAEFPILAANVRFKNGDPVPFLPPYTIIKKEGLKIGVIGITTTRTPWITHPDNVAKLKFLDPVPVTQKYVAELQDKVDMIVLLIHAGTEEEQRIIEKVPGIAISVSADTHEERYVVKERVILVDSGEHGKVLGRLDGVLQDGTLISHSHRFIPITPVIEKYAAVEEILAPYRAGMEERLAEVVGIAAVMLDGEREDIRSRETNLGNLVADVMRKRTGADIAIQNGGGIRTSIDVGPITLKEIFTVLPFDNYVVALELTGAQIWQALENGVGDVSPTGAFPQVSGMSFIFDPTRPCGDRVVEVIIGGKPLDMDRTYIVATNCFLAAGGDMYAMMREARVVLKTGDFLRDAVAVYIREKGIVRPEVEGRIRKKGQAAETFHLTIVHANDLHGRVDLFIRLGEIETVGGLV
ncbi:5'-nucleotidase C-terminal domain-containing protein [Candidatus Acetothermia bacterium]|nr:5'-nucleotidase C-terminal domain-containing protein [Candidatus Acetothermia bacterium]